MGRKNPPATGPLVAAQFSRAFDLLEELHSAGSNEWGEFSADRLSTAQLGDFANRLCQLLRATCADPLELQVLDHALFAVSELLLGIECSRCEAEEGQPGRLEREAQ